MGIYSHLTNAELSAERDKLSAAFSARLTGPTGTGWADKRTQYSDNAVQELRAALAEINAEIDRRISGPSLRRPIYLV
jgi:hypothetical protein